MMCSVHTAFVLKPKIFSHTAGKQDDSSGVGNFGKIQSMREKLDFRGVENGVHSLWTLRSDDAKRQFSMSQQTNFSLTTPTNPVKVFKHAIRFVKLD